jgi:hypothetical protein
VSDKNYRKALLTVKRLKRAEGGDLPAAPDTVYHGSPQTNLNTISATPPSRQYDNATSQFGAYFVPHSHGAEHYAGKSGRVYEAKYHAKNPYNMPVGEWQYYQDISRGPRDADGFRGKVLPSEKWGDRQKELIKEAIEHRKRLEEAGHDGVILRGPKGDIKEMSSFHDTPIVRAPGGRIHRAPGGSLSDAINSFSRQRQNALDPPSASAQNAYQGIPQGYFNNFNRPELVVAQPPQEERATPMAQSADLGSALEDGVNWIQGKEGKPKAPSPTNQALEDPTTTSVAPKVASGDNNGGIGINALMNNISNIESGGRYDARGPVTGSGDRAYGRYQVMGSNIPQWTKETLGTSMTPQQFLNSPEAQDAVAQQKLSEYWKQYGSPEDAASMWFSGRPLSQGAHLRDQLGTSGASYAARAAQGIQGQPLVDSPQRTAAQQVSAAPRGHLQITDPNSDPLTSHTYPAPTEHAAPQPAQPPAPPPIHAQDATTSPPPQLQDATAGPQASADPQSNLYDKVAFMPSVESGYDNPQVLYDPTQTAAKGGSIQSMPSPELIAQALQILARHRAATGGSLVHRLKRDGGGGAGGGGHGDYNQPITPIQNGAWGTATSGKYSGDTTFTRDDGQMSYINPATLGIVGTGHAWDNQTPAPPAAAPAPITPALQGQNVGNAAGATGAPLGNIPMASPGGTGTGGAAAGTPSYNNTLDEALGTNSPTMNQTFGFNYPVPPPPKPQPQGPVSQNLINALYGFGGGSQMGTGTYADGGAIVMDALLRANRARKAKGKR